MPIVDRPEFPRKHKLSGAMLLVVVLAAALGISYHSCSNTRRQRRVTIHSVSFDEYDRTFIRLGYEIENSGPNEEKVILLARVYDSRNEELASLMFSAELLPGVREYRTKVIDKLSRPLREGEKPWRATLELKQRGLFKFE